ncbi:MAG: hypothetical protein IK092_06990, partial [Muribaculaceae bacterium]|nr:hypothetical protein [Muribaculaceae bacterium]
RVNATRCNTGPKQEVINESRNTGYNNVLRNCSFEITDVRTCVDDEQYVLRVARGVKGSTFLVEDCNFKVKTRNKTFVGAMLWNHNVVMNRVNFDLDVTTCWNKNLKTREYEYMPDGAIPALFSGYEWTPDTLHLTMNDVTVTLRGNTRITTMFANAATVNATRFKVVQAEQSKQTLRIDNCIENVVDSKFENSTFDVPFNSFAHTKNRTVKVNNSSILQGKGIVFNGEGDYNAKRFTQGTQFVITNSRIETSSAFTYVSPSVGIYSMKATGNTIKAKTLLDGEQKTGGYQLKKFDVELKNNRLPADAQKLINTKKLTDSKLVNKSTLRVTGNTISTK